jgi:hypothetical protein
MGDNYSILFQWLTAEGFPQEYPIENSSTVFPVPSPGDTVTVPGTAHNPPHPGETTVTLNIVSREFKYATTGFSDGKFTHSLLVLIKCTL